MLPTSLSILLLGLACIPFIYYLIVLFSTFQFFSRNAPPEAQATAAFTPPISNLKPVRGMDPDAYENFASFCRQDYPDFEIIFCVGSEDDPAVPVIRQLQNDFPDVPVRILFGSGRLAANDKVAKLARMAAEARFEHLVISDSDVRVRPDYLRSLIDPLADPRTGAVTCFYVSTGEKSLLDELQSVGMITDFYPGILVAKQLDGVKFALGPTIATTRTRLAGFGGYEAIEDQPGDDLLVGRLIAEDGYRVELLNYSINTVADFGSWNDLWHKRMRWLVVMRHMRPWGHLGLVFTHGLAWSLFGIAVHPTWLTACWMVGLYFFLRLGILYTIGVWGLRQKFSFRAAALVVFWDALAVALWLASFTRSTVRWRGGNYFIRNGKLIPESAAAAQ